jgi:hypothetical protein
LPPNALSRSLTPWPLARRRPAVKGGLIRHASVTYAVQEVGADSCQVTYSIEGQMRPLLAWATPLIPAIGRRLVRSNLANLARLAESTPVA